MYGRLHEGVQTATALLASGRPIADVFTIGFAAVRAGGLGTHAPGNLGHGVGLRPLVELLIVSREETRRLTPGHVLAMAQKKGWTVGGNQPIAPDSVDQSGVETFAYTPGIRGGNTLYISGQVPRDRDGNLVGERDLEAQCVQVYENIKAIVEAAGGSMADIVDTLVIVTHNAHKAVHTEVRKRYFAPPYPCSTAIVAGLSPGYMVEVNAVAVLDS
jgi:enamine deaminase RidA (YjgF/YER057c/UK114 family)